MLSPVYSAERAWITILSTTDLHGNILPIDYYTGNPDARGLAKVASLVRQIRKENPSGTVLLNSGDTIQGTPLLEKARREARFPWLGANTYDTATGQPHYQPYLVKEIDGVRVGVLGLTTPGADGADQQLAARPLRLP